MINSNVDLYFHVFAPRDKPHHLASPFPSVEAAISHGKSKRRTTVTKNEHDRSVSEKGEDRRMARDQQQHQVGEKPLLRKRKSVRFGECPDPGSSGGPAGVVPSIVPHLPGLDPDALYVISGPFPQYDEGSGISNMVAF